jgi:RsiW-degrading membrane proteinase PrsW (M82 family)
MPAWFIIELIILILKIFIKDAPVNTLMSSVIMGCIIGAGFMLSCRYALRKYDNMNRVDAFTQAVITSAYLLLIWFPLVLFIGTKILFMKKDMKWGKTAHGLVRREHAIQRAKEKIRKAKEELKRILQK